MAYDITPKTQPANMDYENSKNFSQLVQVAHDEAQFERTRRANQPSKYTQTLQAINSTLQTVNTGLQVAENVNKVYDQITEKSFKREQLDKQNRLKEKIQGAINEHDWNTVATLAMTNIQTASQMPEYMDSLGRMAKIEGNEGSAAILRSINTEQQGKLEVEEIKNLGKLQVENTKGQFSLQKQALSNQGAMQRAMYNQSQQNARFNTRMQFNQDKAVMMEEGKNIRQQNSIDSKGDKSGKPNRNNFGTAPVNNTTISSDNNATTPTVTEENNTTTTPAEATAPTESNSYINNFKNKTYTVSLANKSQNNKISELRQKGQNAINAPTKQEQAKANQQNKTLLENQQRTSEFVGTFKNRELGSALNDLDVDGVSADEQITNILKNPDKYDVQVETEPYKINNMINGGDNLKNPLNMNLSEKYNNVVAIATITDKTTGKSKHVYLNTQQANLFDDMRNYNKQYPKEFKKAMGEDKINNSNNSSEKINTLSMNQKFSQIRELMTNSNQGIRFANNLGIEPTNTNIKKAAEYITFINSKPNINELKDYVYSDKTLDDVVYDNFNGYRDAGEKFDQYIYDTGESTSKYTDEYLRTQGSYDYFDSSVNVPLDIRKAQRSARSTMSPYSEKASSRKELAERLSVPYTSGVEIGNNNPDKNIKYLTKNVVDNYVPSNYKEAVMGNESLSRNVVLLAATASELGYNNNEIKDIIKVGLSSEKPLTIPQVLKKYDPKKYKALEKIGISDIPTLVGSALFGTPERVYDKLTGQKNDY